MDYSQLASDEALLRTVTALGERNFEAIIVDSKDEALATVKGLILAGASINNGASRTLEEIGFVDYLKSGEHGWNNLHGLILSEQDPIKKATLRKQASLSEYYLGSVHALAETGEIVVASNTGSQLPGIAFTSPNVIFVVGTQKIVPTLTEALRRLREYVVPLEDTRMKSVGMAGTILSKILILEKEPPFMQRKVRVVLVKEKLGF